MAFTSSAVPLQLTGCTAGASQLLPYCFTINLQGDILAILDSAGNTVVQYAYDAWGGKKTTTGSMAGTLGYLNPFRYRGYVWDEETWMYYLRSRYYYPELQRFISPDIYIMGNLFCYCLNSPVDTIDLTGLFPFNILEVPMVPVERLPYTAQKMIPLEHHRNARSPTRSKSN